MCSSDLFAAGDKRTQRAKRGIDRHIAMRGIFYPRRFAQVTHERTRQGTSDTLNIHFTVLLAVALIQLEIGVLDQFAPARRLGGHELAKLLWRTGDGVDA